MRTNSISTNHVELTAGSLLAVFSYGKPIAYSVNGCIVLNRDYYHYSTTTTKHVNLTFPMLKTETAISKYNVVSFPDGEFCQHLATAIYNQAGVK